MGAICPESAARLPGTHSLLVRTTQSSHLWCLPVHLISSRTPPAYAISSCHAKPRTKRQSLLLAHIRAPLVNFIIFVNENDLNIFNIIFPSISLGIKVAGKISHVWEAATDQLGCHTWQWKHAARRETELKFIVNVYSSVQLRHKKDCRISNSSKE